MVVGSFGAEGGARWDWEEMEDGMLVPKAGRLEVEEVDEEVEWLWDPLEQREV